MNLEIHMTVASSLYRECSNLGVLFIMRTAALFRSGLFIPLSSVTALNRSGAE